MEIDIVEIKHNHVMPYIDFMIWVYMKNLDCSCNSGADMCFVIFNQFCQTEIWNFGVEILVKQHITCLYISMYDFNSGLFIEFETIQLEVSGFDSTIWRNFNLALVTENILSHRWLSGSRM